MKGGQSIVFVLCSSKARDIIGFDLGFTRGGGFVSSRTRRQKHVLLPKDLVVQKTHSIDLGLTKACAHNNSLRARGSQIAVFNKVQKSVSTGSTYSTCVMVTVPVHSTCNLGT